MNSTVKKIEIAYNSINERNTFTNGDFITGQVTVEMGKDSQIESLFVKFKAKAEVMWTETHGDHTVVYHSKDKYFTQKQYFIRNKNVKEKQHVQLTNQNTTSYPSVLAPGVHVYPFCFQIPLQGIPSSFKGSDGKIVFSLEAELSRSMRINKKSSTTINFVAKPDPNTLPGLMTPVRNSKDKKMHVFTSGSVAMEVNLEKSGFFQGEGIKVVSSIQNNSSREVKPKYCLYRKHSFYAQGNKRYHTKDLVKEVGASIPKKTSETVKQVITIPHDAEPSILNCNIIKAEYRLKVYLDIKFASDPAIKFDIVILRGSQGSAGLPPSYSAAAGLGPEAFGNSAPAPWNPAPPSGNPAPPAWNPAPPAWNPAPPSGNPAPPAWNPAPPAWNPAPPAWNPAPPAWNPAPTPGNPAPPPGNQAPLQPSSVSSPLPPSYGTHQLYPSPNDFSQKKF
ncbi:arrestin domain-containing protein 3 isoform X1 [Oryzias latipes]|uniref:Si:ch211-130m23.2 n=1 Tax=Oryzias latipes TaxID=8090 RepID=A0A3B3IFS5_ORYLA|nr:arrestin domain-containing protein 3 isoform X1 [Oryzias latipes]